MDYYYHFVKGQIMISLIPLLCLAFPSISSSSYPQQWIKKGECLDFNEGPLQRDVVPLNNENVGKVTNATSVQECADKCFKLKKCGYFTFYDETERREGDCLLVGFNLKGPCFELKNKCIHHIECQQFSNHCQNCSTGIRPLTDQPGDDERIILFNGDVDDPNYLENESELLSDSLANNMELITLTGTCVLNSAGLLPRVGSVGVLARNKILNCGGYSSRNSTYLSTCLSLSSDGPPFEWKTFSSLSVPRAYGRGVHILGHTYILGGYNSNDGFLDSVESLGNVNWTTPKELTLLKGKSHFCALTTSNYEIIIIGGWNGKYIKDVDIMSFYSNGTLKAGWASFFKALTEPRSDAACIETKISWESGILVAGGYDSDQTWKSSMEFYSYAKGTWSTITSLPALTIPRHYHGMDILNSIPYVFGGWNNGAIDSIETLDKISSENNGTVIKWRTRPDLQLNIRREKFGYVKVPTKFKKLKC